MKELFPNARPISKTAQNILQKRYFNAVLNETKWEQIADRSVDNIIDEEGEDKETIRAIIRNTYFVPNSPCLVNAGKQGAGLSACYVVDFPDTIEGIFKTKLDFALIARKGGGCGTSLSKIRPEGETVHGSTHGYAGGPIKFANTISHDADALTQAGFRSMAIMFTMDVKHPDIIKFITAKEEEGVIANANMSVMVDNDFMTAVENDDTYWTEFNGKKYQEYKAKDVFNLMVQGSWANGEPGVLFRDRIDKSPYKEVGQEIFSTNPCLSKDTILQDKNRLCKISDNSQNFKSWKTGIKSCIKITTNAGHELVLTPDHKIMLSDESFIEAKDSLGKQIKWGLGNNKKQEDQTAEILGFLFGDGSLCARDYGVSVKINKDKEPEIYSRLITFGFVQEPCGDLYLNRKIAEKKLGHNLDFLNKNTYDRTIPDDILYSSYLGSFLSGIFEANGSVAKSTSQISFKSTSEELIKQLQVALSSFGVQSWKVINKPSIIQWKNGIYTSKKSYNLQVAPRNTGIFKSQIGFVSRVKNDKIRRFTLPYFGKLKVVSIEDAGMQEVWDFENQNHYNSCNGFVAHNCSEQPLPPKGVCNLGSIDLSKLLTKNKQLDWEKLSIIVRLAVRFLDSVIDKTTYPTEEIKEWSLANRPIGLGIMGYADYLLIKQIAYGTPDALNELENIMEFIHSKAEEESTRLGQELGIPEECKKLSFPRRNITLLTVAPTGTISLIAGCSSGIEPVFSEITIRNDKTGTYTFENNLADKSYFRCAVSSNGATEVTWEEHIKTLASAQKYVDSGVSKTINFPTHTHKDTMAKAIIMAWKEGCKGVAMYRNGSRKTEVLSPKNLKKDKCPICGNDMVVIDEKKKCLVCTKDVVLGKFTTSYD